MDVTIAQWQISIHREAPARPEDAESRLERLVRQQQMSAQVARQREEAQARYLQAGGR